MHILQPKHTKLKPAEVNELLARYNISLSQLPKISKKDAMINDTFQSGEVIKFERKEGDKLNVYYRVIA